MMKSNRVRASPSMSQDAVAPSERKHENEAKGQKTRH